MSGLLRVSHVYSCDVVYWLYIYIILMYVTDDIIAIALTYIHIHTLRTRNSRSIGTCFITYLWDKGSFLAFILVYPCSCSQLRKTLLDKILTFNDKHAMVWLDCPGVMNASISIIIVTWPWQKSKSRSNNAKKSRYPLAWWNFWKPLKHNHIIFLNRNF